MLNFQLPGCPILCFYWHVSYNSAVWGPSGQPSLQTAHGTFLSPWKVLLCPFPANPSKPSLLAFFLLAFFGWEGAEGPRAPAAWGAYSLSLWCGAWGRAVASGRSWAGFTWDLDLWGQSTPATYAGETQPVAPPARVGWLHLISPLCRREQPTWGRAFHFLESSSFRFFCVLSSLKGFKILRFCRWCGYFSLRMNVTLLGLPHPHQKGASSPNTSDSPTSSKSVGAIFPTAFAPFVSLLHFVNPHNISSFLTLTMFVIVMCVQWSLTLLLKLEGSDD